MCLESESEVTQLCPALCYPMGCSLPGSSIHGIIQATILEWVAVSFSKYVPQYSNILKNFKNTAQKSMLILSIEVFYFSIVNYFKILCIIYLLMLYYFQFINKTFVHQFQAKLSFFIEYILSFSQASISFFKQPLHFQITIFL